MYIPDSNFEVRHARCVSNKSNVKCIQYDVKHNLVLDGVLGRTLCPKHVVEFTFSKTNTPSNTKLCLTSYCINFTFDFRFKIRSANLHLVKGKGKSKVNPITGHEGPEGE